MVVEEEARSCRRRKLLKKWGCRGVDTEMSWHAWAPCSWCRHCYNSEEDEDAQSRKLMEEQPKGRTTPRRGERTGGGR